MPEGAASRLYRLCDVFARQNCTTSNQSHIGAEATSMVIRQPVASYAVTARMLDIDVKTLMRSSNCKSKKVTILVAIECHSISLASFFSPVSYGIFVSRVFPLFRMLCTSSHLTHVG